MYGISFDDDLGNHRHGEEYRVCIFIQPFFVTGELKVEAEIKGYHTCQAKVMQMDPLISPFGGFRRGHQPCGKGIAGDHQHHAGEEE
jgi:hypothetical protein